MGIRTFLPPRDNSAQRRKATQRRSHGVSHAGGGTASFSNPASPSEEEGGVRILQTHWPCSRLPRRRIRAPPSRRPAAGAWPRGKSSTPLRQFKPAGLRTPAAAPTTSRLLKPAGLPSLAPLRRRRVLSAPPSLLLLPPRPQLGHHDLGQIAVAAPAPCPLPRRLKRTGRALGQGKGGATQGGEEGHRVHRSVGRYTWTM